MADLAMIFHWAPADMDAMTLTELADWREAARDRMPEPPKDHRQR